MQHLKQPYQAQKRVFDNKFVFVGDSGSGKTHLCGTYTRGPLHFYMFDKGGQTTLDKLLPTRPKEHPVTIDYFDSKTTFDSFWQQIQKDDKDGFFADMATKNGIVVLPDSMTTFCDVVLASAAKKTNRVLTDPTKPMRIQDWGLVAAWIKQFIQVVNDLPCAVILTAHTHIDTDENGAVIRKVPGILGSIRNNFASYFSEVYYLQPQGKNFNLHCRQYQHFVPKSRILPEAKYTNITLDQIYDYYIHNKPIKEGGNQNK